MNRRRLDSMKATATATAPSAPRPEALDAIAPDKLVELDVREDLRNGREPFSLIMAARQRVPEGGALAVRAIFEPVPLYQVMGKQGFEHYTEQLGDEDWRVWFYPSAPAAAVSTPAAPVPPNEEPDPGVIVLDVREMEPPEPMVLTLAALETLPPDRTLLQINVRVPQFLLPLLEERGFSYEVRQQAPDLVRVFIRHRVAGTPDQPHQSRGTPMATARTLDVRVIPPGKSIPRSSAPFPRWRLGSRSFWSTTTTRSRCAISSTTSTPANSAGSTSSRGHRCGGWRFHARRHDAAGAQFRGGAGRLTG